jgi:hypothetical protein
MDSAPSVDDHYKGLGVWWSCRGKDFSLWFLSMSFEEQCKILRTGCSDIPESIALDSTSKITDVLVPDLTISGLLSGNGKLFILFIARIVVSFDHCLADDIRRIRNVKTQGRLPDLSGGVSSTLKLPHVNPVDPLETVHQLSADASESTVSELIEDLKNYRLVELDVWLAVKLRRMTISSFLVAIFQVFEKFVSELTETTQAQALVAKCIANEQRIRLEFDTHPSTTTNTLVK